MTTYQIPAKSFEKIQDNLEKILKDQPSTSTGFWCREIEKELWRVKKPESIPPKNSIIHDLKIHPTYFKETVEGTKNNEIRLADRPFAIGDWLLLREWNPQSQQYTGQQIYKEITYITKAVFDLDRYWVLSLRS